MYSRSFSEGGGNLPPHYSGTALREQERDIPKKGKEGEAVCEAPTDGVCAPCPPPPQPPPPPHGGAHGGKALGGLLGRLLPGVDEGDLMLLGIALLLLFDGCEDEFLPLILLFLLVVH